MQQQYPRPGPQHAGASQPGHGLPTVALLSNEVATKTAARPLGAKLSALESELAKQTLELETALNNFQQVADAPFDIDVDTLNEIERLSQIDHPAPPKRGHICRC